MFLTSRAADVASFTSFNADKIVGVWEGSFNRATDVITHTGDSGDIYLYRIPHGFTRPVFTDLLWKLGSAWADGGSLDGASEISIAFSDSTYVYIVSSVFAPAVGTMQYKVIGTWIDSYDNTNPLVEPFLGSNKSTLFDSRDNYQKIYDQNVLSFAADGTQPVTHTLGYRANFRVFHEAITGEVWPMFAGGGSNPFLYDSSFTDCRARMSTTALAVQLENVASTKRAWYKIYLDQ